MKITEVIQKFRNHLEITEAVLFHGNIVKDNYQQDLIFLSCHVRVAE